MFCLAYIGIRLTAQIPFVVSQKAYRVESIRQLKVIIVLGVVGASLQLSEFSGIANGENVSTVTFLVYTHPFWSILISKFIFKEELGKIGLIKLVLALIGIVLVIGVENFEISKLVAHWVSLAAGLLISIWIKVSNIARKIGFSTLKTNFYYDLMSFICVVSLICIYSKEGGEFYKLSEYLSVPSNLCLIVGYSLLIGLLPNLLFYKGSASTDSLTAGYILLLEPIIASTTAYLFWDDKVSLTFMAGALMILSANIPDELLSKTIKSSSVKLMLVFLVATSVLAASASEGKKIYLVEIIPQDSSDYTIASEKKQIEIAAVMGLEKFKQSNKCDIEVESSLYPGSEEDLINKIKILQKDKSEKVIVGLSRTNFSRAAAKVAVGTNIKGISVGASASNLGAINKNFITIVNPWEVQFNLIKKVIQDNKCKPDETSGVFDATNFLSNNFLESYKAEKLGVVLARFDPSKLDKNTKCLFIGMNFSESSLLLSSLGKTNWAGSIIGIGDWNIHSHELDKITKNISSKISITVPTGWIPEANLKSSRFSKDFYSKSGDSASPIAAYVYDGIILAAEVVCNGANLQGRPINSPNMLRNYKGRNNTGNLLSDMYLRNLKGEL